MDEQRHEYKTLHGARSANSCAYCYNHHCALTPRQVKQRECLKKQCGALRRYDHPYWEQREKSKALRAARKERLEGMWKEMMSNAICPEKASADRG
jgi:hypothetical protein